MEQQKPAFHQDRVFLYGPSGSGKTSVGRILAGNLGLPFIDLDEWIEHETGRSIPVLFQTDGEHAFRSQETEALKAVLREGEGVLALGGGTLISPVNQHLISKNGVVVVLNASAHDLVSRLEQDNEKRPLLVGELEHRLQDYLFEREDHYASFPKNVDTTGKIPEEVAWEIQTLLGLFYLQGMSSQIHPGYDLRIKPGGIDDIGKMLVQRGLRGPVVVVTDENVGNYYLPRILESFSYWGIETGNAVIHPGEEFKTMETVAFLWEEFLNHRVERSSTIVALGGGVVGDLTGFAAATYLRGVSWVSIPTSLLAMVDSGVGGKTGVDLPQGKNMVGAFHPPCLVLVDPEVLSTLPESEFINGMAEVVKHCVIGDTRLESRCQKTYLQYKPDEIFELLSRAIAVKIKIIEQDPFEKGVRAALNYGHTVGHGVELVSNYKLRHGEAVAIGMVIEAQMAESIGLADEGLVETIKRKLGSLGLPVKIPASLDRELIVHAMKYDKKTFLRRVRFALPVRLGEVQVGIEVEGWENYLYE